MSKRRANALVAMWLLIAAAPPARAGTAEPSDPLRQFLSFVAGELD